MAVTMWASEKTEQDPVRVLEGAAGAGEMADSTLGPVHGGAEEGTPPCCGVVKEGFLEEVTSKLSPEGWKGLSQVRVGIMCSWRGEYVQRPKCGEWDLLENLK